MEQSKWEYKVLCFHPDRFVTVGLHSQFLEELLNDAAKRGYELVNTIPINTNGFTNQIHVILKRVV